LANQYHNPINPQTHYETTGPEIWEQTRGQIKVLVVGMGTGGTITGTGRYLKEKNPEIKIVGVDPMGSLLYDTWRLGRVPDEPFLKTYKVEGIGEDFVPGALDLSVCDEVLQTSDKEAFVMTRRLVREEGIFCGGSSGSAVAGALNSKYVRALRPGEIAVVILPDSGSRYLSKIFNDDWMRENGFLEEPWAKATVTDLLAAKKQREVIAVDAQDRLPDVIKRMQEYDISQMPVLDDGKLVGMVTESSLLNRMMRGEHSDSIESIIDRHVTTIGGEAYLQDVMSMFGASAAIVVTDHDRVAGIITKIDLIDYLSTHSQ
jgi:cystathionine beta-synthase